MKKRGAYAGVATSTEAVTSIFAEKTANRHTWSSSPDFLTEVRVVQPVNPKTGKTGMVVCASAVP